MSAPECACGCQGNLISALQSGVYAKGLRLVARVLLTLDAQLLLHPRAGQLSLSLNRNVHRL